jgi:hydroxymethylpyrimidine pyrophosphatase-like HAD family hydrolase
MNMMFGTDLDNTIIYSKKHIQDENLENLIAVDHYNGDETSFVTQRTYELVCEMVKRGFFIPVTTRTVKQYRRISIFQEFQPKYAVTTSGAKIFVDGNEWKSWSQQIDQKLERLRFLPHQVFQWVTETLSNQSILHYRFSDDYFWSFVLDLDLVESNEIVSLNEKLCNTEWRLSFQGRKLYIIPKFIDKWEALQCIADMEDGHLIYSAGDTFLDHSMVFNAHRGFVPRDSELMNYVGKSDSILITEEKGLLAGEEICERVLTMWNKTCSLMKNGD